MNNTEIIKQGLTDIQEKLNKFGDFVLKLDEVYNYNAEDELQFLRDIQDAYESYHLSVSTLAGKIAKMPDDEPRPSDEDINSIQEWMSKQ